MVCLNLPPRRVAQFYSILARSPTEANVGSSHLERARHATRMKERRLWDGRADPGTMLASQA
jgi:hypothetical protein